MLDDDFFEKSRRDTEHYRECNIIIDICKRYFDFV